MSRKRRERSITRGKQKIENKKFKNIAIIFLIILFVLTIIIFARKIGDFVFSRRNKNELSNLENQIKNTILESEKEYEEITSEEIISLSVLGKINNLDGKHNLFKNISEQIKYFDYCIANQDVKELEIKKVEDVFIKQIKNTKIVLIKENEKLFENIDKIEKESDFLIVILEESNDEKEKKLLEKSVDMMIKYSDKLEKMQVVKNNDEEDCIIVNSLGNIDIENEKSIILNVKIYKMKGEKAKLYQVDFLQTYTTKIDNELKLINMRDEIFNYEIGKSNISEELYTRLKEIILENKELLTNE